MKAVLAVVGLLGLGACAGPPALSAASPASSYRDAISVGSVSVGADTPTPWRSEIGPDQIKDALAQTLIAARLGRTEVRRFRLDAVLLTLQRPYAGFAMTVTASIAYRLTDAATGAVVYTTTITTPGAASLNDAVLNDARLRIADERAVRANLRRLVEELDHFLSSKVSAAPFMQ